mmetsp:Transcript_84012/g.133158  ORF Transcript_84012/g.133158 Transcript_84012/m.133158 type:complete len:406 (+) Transcript_84012:86-1303(+)
MSETMSPEMMAALQQQVASLGQLGQATTGLESMQLAAVDPAQQAALTEAQVDPNSLAVLSALGMVPGMMPGLTGVTGLTGMDPNSVAGLTSMDPNSVASMSALMNPQYAAAAQAASANAIALYYQALAGLGISPTALTTTASLDTAPTGGRHFTTKPGDWNCKACGDLQFARNTKCRRCGAEKPSEAELAAAGPVRTNVSPDGRPMRPGDWICPICADHVFAKNEQCRKCGHPRPAHVLAQMQSQRNQGTIAREGDWNCQRCGDLQFARNAACRRCGAEKPENAGLTPPPVTTPAATPVPVRSPTGGDLRPGDWMCPKCHDHVFARNENCRRCGQARPTGADLAAMAAAGTLPPATNPIVARTSGADLKPGDWKCEKCGDLVFARNNACRRCGNSRPDRSRSPLR